MIEKILNKLGLYTERQYDELNNEYGVLELKIFKLEKQNKKLIEALKASEEAKANAVKENEKLKSDYKNVVAALKVCEDEKSELLAENDDLRRALENRKKQVDLLLNDFERASKENEELDYRLPDDEYQELNEQLVECEKAREFNERLLEEYKWKKEKK